MRAVKHWRLAQIVEIIETLTTSAVPVEALQRGCYEQHLAQAAYWLGMAVQYIPLPPPSQREPVSRPPEDLLVPPHVPLAGRRVEVWRASKAAEERHRRLYAATPRDLRRVSSTLGGFGTGPKLVTFDYPSGAKVPAIEGVPS